MISKSFSTILNLSDGIQTVSLNYGVSISNYTPMEQNNLEDLILNSIASELDFSFNGEFFESISYCSVTLSKIKEIQNLEFEVLKRVFPYATFEINGNAIHE